MSTEIAFFFDREITDEEINDLLDGLYEQECQEEDDELVGCPFSLDALGMSHSDFYA